MKIELLDSTDKIYLFVSVGFIRVAFLLLKISTSYFLNKVHTKWLLKIQLVSSFFEALQDNVEEVLVLLDKLLAELQSPLYNEYSPSCKKNRSRLV